MCLMQFFTGSPETLMFIGCCKPGTMSVATPGPGSSLPHILHLRLQGLILQALDVKDKVAFSTCREMALWKLALALRY